MLHAKVWKGRGAARWTTRVTVPKQVAPFYGITEDTQWQPYETGKMVIFRPATPEEIARGDTWKTITRKAPHVQYMVSIPIKWAAKIDPQRGVTWRNNGDGLYGELKKL